MGVCSQLVFNVVLFQPEIPPNTGNIIRLCANTGSRLHLIRPLGFELDDKRLRRAGLDYHEFASVAVHDDIESARAVLGGSRWFAFSTRGRTPFDQPAFRSGDCLLFGPETRGLPQEVLASLPPGQRLRLPMLPGQRSLNLSNTVAIALYQAWGQLGYAGADPGG